MSSVRFRDITIVYKQQFTSSARSMRYVRHSLLEKTASQAYLQSFSGSSLQAIYGYQLASTSYNQVLQEILVSGRWSTVPGSVQACAHSCEAYSAFIMQSQTRREIAYYQKMRREQWLGYCFTKSLPYEIQAILAQNERDCKFVLM